ncbi:DUF6768 family protein [Thalassotalea fusca]
MNIDDKIRAELEHEAKSIDQALAHDAGIFTMLANAYKGALGRWIIIVGIFTFALTVLMFWAGYHFFFTEGSVAMKLHWGVLLLLATMVQIALKMWTFMEMNRQSTLRELKRIEFSIESLAEQVRPPRECE